ncbi:hypothetical protein KFE25_009034 [Diacronema lutheri]|uniref:LTD domain-containing protein n=1 Tax=Diacronema lutheri TaxID=2081491 RepID=A0A8J5XM29_DIALT|nr:hypothetical protein KFE25_009034 [Diacronema lutheri]
MAAVLLLQAIRGSTPPVSAAEGCGCLLISGAYAGAGRDSYVELYNACDVVLDLSRYALQICSAGCPSHNPLVDLRSFPFGASARLAPGQVFTLVDPHVDPQIASRLSSARSSRFPANASEPPLLGGRGDAYAIRISTGELMDSLGDIAPAPSLDVTSTGVAIAGVMDALNGTVVTRKATVRAGNCGKWEASAGSGPSDSEWLVHPASVELAASLVGAHPSGAPSPPPYPPFPPLGGTCALGCLFFSEYAHAAPTSSERYVEIFNGCARAVRTSDLQLRVRRDGSSEWDVRRPLLAASLLPGEVYLVADFRGPHEVVALADMLSVDFGQGSDAIALWSRLSGTVLDTIGALGEATPADGSGWAVAGIANATLGHRLVRRPTVRRGNCGNWSASAGNSAASSEWLVTTLDATLHAVYDHAHLAYSLPPPPSLAARAPPAESSPPSPAVIATDRPRPRAEGDAQYVLALSLTIATALLVLLALACFLVPSCPWRERRKRRLQAAATAPDAVCRAARGGAPSIQLGAVHPGRQPAVAQPAFGPAWRSAKLVGADEILQGNDVVEAVLAAPA